MSRALGGGVGWRRRLVFYDLSLRAVLFPDFLVLWIIIYALENYIFAGKKL